jgi:hypothetical protein
MRIRLMSVCVLVLSMPAAGQVSTAHTRTLLVDLPLHNDPVRIMKVMEGTTELKSDGHQFPNRYVWESTFEAGDRWLKDISLVIRNVSTKKITYLGISCGLFETSDWETELAKHSINGNPILGQALNIVGWRPERALYSVRLGHAVKPDSERRPPFELAPQQQFTMMLEDPQSYSDLKSSVELRQPMSAVTACDTEIFDVFFEDGTRWSEHHYLQAADEPGHWRTISFDDWSKSATPTE